MAAQGAANRLAANIANANRMCQSILGGFQRLTCVLLNAFLLKMRKSCYTIPRKGDFF